MQEKRQKVVMTFGSNTVYCLDKIYKKTKNMSQKVRLCTTELIFSLLWLSPTNKQ